MFKKIKLWLGSGRYKFKHMLTLSDAEARFTYIFNNRLWSNRESLSGSGSTLAFTQNIRQELPKIFEKFHISSVLDAPCGDFNWMQHVLKKCPTIHYIGGDIVGQLIQKNTQNYATERIQFIQLDITKNPLPDADLMIVRDCLFHLSYADIALFLRNLSRANIRYLLTTSHPSTINADILTGNYRPIDLFSAPFNFPDTALYTIEEDARQLYLFECASLNHALNQNDNSRE